MARPSLYIDACALIDLVKAKREIDLPQDRTTDTWYLNCLMHSVATGEVRLVTSMLTVTECIHIGEDDGVHPETQELFRSFLASGDYIELVAPDIFVAERGRDFCWDKGVTPKGADLLHLATALIERCTEFLTTDERLKGKLGTLQAAAFEEGLSLLRPSQTGHLPGRFHEQLFDA